MRNSSFYIPKVNIFKSGVFTGGGLLVEGGRAAVVGEAICPDSGVSIFKLNNCFLFPGFVDVHVHLREPGFSYKETIFDGTRGAARGGYTTVCTMPNLDPVPDSLEHLTAQTEIIRCDSAINVLPMGAMTLGERGGALADMEAMAPYVAGFSDDGRGVQSAEMMKAAMTEAKRLGKLIVSHCEDESAPPEDGEWRQLERDLELVRQTGCGYHMCHISKSKSLELIIKAKKEGLNVTCETAPHYLLLDSTMLQDDGRFKMNPPIGRPDDRAALIEGIKTGAIDMIATDHAPHSIEEKSAGFAKSLNGIVGLETAFSALYTGLVRCGKITLERLIQLMSINPARRFGFENSGFTVFDLEDKYTIDSDKFLSKGRSTPFEGWKVYGRCLLTAVNGNIVWEDIINAEKN